MKKKLLALTLGLSGSALAAALILPVTAQESLLPEGFGSPPAPTPAPTPAPGPTPTPSAPSAPKPGVPATPGAKPTVEDAADAEDEAADEDEEEVEGAISSRLKYDLPPGARRLLTRTGPLPPAPGGRAPQPAGVRAHYAPAPNRTNT